MFLAMLFFALSQQVCAYDFCEDGLYYKVESKNYNICQVTCQSRSHNDYSGHIAVPSVVVHEGVEYYVVGVDGHAFDNSAELLSVRFPATISKVERAFSNCPNLRHITFEGTTVPTLSKGALEGIKVYVPNEALDSYALARNCGNVKFLPLYYTVRFVVDDEEISNTTMRMGDKINVPQVEARRGHKFSGWDGLPADTLMVDRDLVIDGSFSAKIFRIAFLVEGDTIQSRRMRYGATIEYPQVPNDGPYEFSGWTHRPKGGKMPAKKVTVEGHYRLNAQKAVRMAEITTDTIVCYRVTHAVQSTSSPKASAPTRRNGRALPMLPVGRECWDRPDEVEMMQRWNDGWYRHVLDYKGKCEVHYIPDDSVEVKALYAITDFPSTMLHRGPVTFRSRRGDTFRIFRFRPNGHVMREGGSDKTLDVKDVEYVIEHYYLDASGRPRYVYTLVGWVEGTTGFIRRANAFPLDMEHAAVISDQPIFDAIGRQIYDAQIGVTYYHRQAFLVPAENAVYMFSSDDEDKQFEKYELLNAD